jgi:hypothetical protein
MKLRSLAPLASCLSAALCISCGSSSDGSAPASVDNDGGMESAVPDAAEAGPEAEPDAPAGMKPGEIKEFVAAADGSLQLEIPKSAADESYIAILYSASWVTEMEYGYTLSTTPSQAQSQRTPARPRSASASLLARAHAPWRFPSSVPTPPPPPPPPATPPNVGDHRNFKVMDATWKKVLTVDGECIKVGSSLAIWLDRTTTDPAVAAVDPTKLDDIVNGFAGTVLPRHHTFFGQESDVDQDGLIHVLYTPILAKMGTVAYFFACDLAKMSGCLLNNNMELIYATPPDLIQGTMMSSVSSILETLAHESQHLVYFNRKHILNTQLLADENPYLQEALAGMGEDLSGYGNGTFFVWSAALDSMGDVSGPDLLDPSIPDYITDRDGVLRGAGYLLYRYLYDQAGGNEFAKGNAVTDKGGVAWMRNVCDAPELGTDMIEKATGRPILDLLFDWYTAVVLSGRPGPGGTPLVTDPKYNYLPVTWDPDTKSSTGKDERHGADPFGANPMDENSPLTGPTIVDAAQADQLIRAGGVEYLRFAGSTTGPTLAKIVPVDPAASLRLRLVREK